ncbi:hypothetical protein PBRA_005275 [Plasmodiophora brassicae]|uniref:Uncharacterized protein n=1 Tax=Plasmodiophora brassicae TaxID=37360 RepID=A0A0G4INC4_PLABS|nr:hypothetical protein PBRA_005275 [Plasmodiophora brassicae]
MRFRSPVGAGMGSCRNPMNVFQGFGYGTRYCDRSNLMWFCSGGVPQKSRNRRRHAIDGVVKAPGRRSANAFMPDSSSMIRSKTSKSWMAFSSAGDGHNRTLKPRSFADSSKDPSTRSSPPGPPERNFRSLSRNVSKNTSMERTPAPSSFVFPVATTLWLEPASLPTTLAIRGFPIPFVLIGKFRAIRNVNMT